MKLQLIDNWKVYAAHAWSSKFNYLAIFLSGLEVAVQFISKDNRPPWFAAAAGVVTIAAQLSRLIKQPKLQKIIEKD